MTGDITTPLSGATMFAGSAVPLARTRSESLPTVILKGAELHAITEIQCVEFVLNEITLHRGGSVVTMNLDHLRRFARDREYAARCRNATIVTADGMPLIWASRLQRTPLPERVTGSNLIFSLTAAAARQNKSVFLIGGTRSAARKTADILLSRYPGLRVAGVHSESIDPKNGGETLKRLTKELAMAAPDIVYVALGSPKQEELIDKLRATLPDAWWLGLGIAFSFVSGEIRRAPRWMQQSGLEWLHRLAQEPMRLTRRYLIVGLPFAARLLFSSALVRFRKPEIRDPEPANDFSSL
jgi:N-acetylglucosaminyldiphosphoundecaprenol N-acetyl-beta-D-mannosaminyltransferase